MVYVRGIIGDEYDLQTLIGDVGKEKGDVIHVKINSVGGCADTGIKMFEYLRGTGKTIITESYKKCCSAASLIFCAGDKRIAGCDIMIHNPWIEIQGDADYLSEVSKEIKAVENAYKKIYMSVSGLTEMAISPLMDYETYISPKNAVNMGLATELASEIVKEKKIVAKAFINNTNKKVEMNKTKKKTVARFSKAFEAAKKMSKKIKSLVYVTDSGLELIVDREEGDPEVGDSAGPDGEFVIAGIGVVTVEDGVIIRIDDANAEVDDMDAEEAIEKLEEAAQVLEDLAEYVEDIREELNEANAKAKTDEEKEVLAIVARMGGLKGLKKAMSKETGTYKVPERKSFSMFGERKRGEDVETGLSKKLKASQDRARKMYNK